MKANKPKTAKHSKRGNTSKKKHINKYASLEMLHDAQGSQRHNMTSWQLRNLGVQTQRSIYSLSCNYTLTQAQRAVTN